MSVHAPFIHLDQRFALIKEIIGLYQSHIKHLEEHVVRLFAENELSAISESIREKERIERRIQKLEQFIARWESAAELSID